MGQEIERKFLVADDSWRARVERRQFLQQGYLCQDDRLALRVRLAGEQAYLTIKSATPGSVRTEYEYAIPPGDGKELLAALCQHRLEKTRYWVRHGEQLWEIDEFGGANQGLVVAEIELQSATEVFASPPWLGAEVTEQRRYYNAQLAQRPFGTWLQE